MVSDRWEEEGEKSLKRKRRVRSRILAWLLAVCLLATSAPVWAAEDAGFTQGGDQEIGFSEETVESQEEEQSYLINFRNFFSYTEDEVGDSPNYGVLTYERACQEDGTKVNVGIPGERYYWQSEDLKEGLNFRNVRLVNIRPVGLSLTTEEQEELNRCARTGEKFYFTMPENEVEFQVYAYFYCPVVSGNGVVGGSVEIDNELPVTGEHVSIRAVPDEGYVFAGWKSVQAASVGESMELDADASQADNGFTVPLMLKGKMKYVTITATPRFEEVSGTLFDVDFTSQEGEGTAPESMEKAKGEQFVLPENPYVNEGRTFLGWSDGTKIYQPGETYTMPFQAVTFTAQWRNATCQDIWFLAGDAYDPKNEVRDEAGNILPAEKESLGVEAAEPGEQITLPENPYVHLGTERYDFVGWSDGTKIYQPGEPYTVGTETVTFTAQWERYYYFAIDKGGYSNLIVSSEFRLQPEDADSLRKLQKEERAPLGRVENLSWGMLSVQQSMYYYEYAGIEINGERYTADTELKDTGYFDGTVRVHVDRDGISDESGYIYSYVEFLDGTFTGDVQIRPVFERTTTKTENVTIQKFVLGGIQAKIEGNEILVRLGESVDVTRLAPKITLSEGATVAPGSGEEQDFTQPVIYRVTSSNQKVTRAYRVTVQRDREYLQESLPPVLEKSIASKQGDNGLILGDEDFLGQVSSPYTDWAAFSLGRYGYVQPDGSVRFLFLDGEDNQGVQAFLEAMEAYVNQRYNEHDGMLDPMGSRATEWQRAILAIASVGGDPTDFGNWNGDSIDLVADGTYHSTIEPSHQGINGSVFALLAKNSKDYAQTAEVIYSDEYLVKEILGRQIYDTATGIFGGWDFGDRKNDPDMTGMAIQALAPYYWDDTVYTYAHQESGLTFTKTVRQAVDEGLQVLSDLQLEDGDYASWDTVNVESTAQALVAVTALGINPMEDQRFIKNGNTLIDGILKYEVQTGGFRHVEGGTWNYMATDQANYALISAWRYANGMRNLYDMRPEFTQQQQEQIQALKDTIDKAVAKKGQEGYYEALCSAKETYDREVAGFEDPTLRNYISNYWELMDALEAEESQGVKQVINLIDGIGTVTLKSEAAIQAAREAYDALDETQQGQVTNYETLVQAEQTLRELKEEQSSQEIQQVTKLIDGIGAVTLESESAIVQAEQAYQNLSEAQQKLVANYETLVAARETYDSLKDAYDAFCGGKPEVKAQSTAYNSIRVTWEPYENAKSYYVYRKTAGGSFQRIAWVQDLTDLSYTDKTAVTGTTYYYTVKAASKTWGDVVYSKYVTNVTGKASLDQGTITKAQTWGYNAVKVSWKQVAGASGYRLYYKTSPTGKYNYVTQIGKGSTTSYVHTGRTTGKTYYYLLRAYRTVNGKQVFGAYSAMVQGKAVPKQAVITKATAGSKKVTLSWSKVTGASGYRIYYKTSKDGAWKYATQIGKGTTTSYTHTGLKKGQTYYYTMRAYRTVGSEKVFGAYASWKTAKAK